MEIRNFGRNVSFRPASHFTPTTEEEVLEILRANRGRQIRTVGRLHSWSEAPKSEDVLLDLRHLKSVQIQHAHGQSFARCGAGCQIKHAIAELNRAGLALPSQGLITEQTLAGAISTGTHGSGKNSFSHYAEEIRVAVYDPQTGEPIIRTIRDGAELLAARCAIGCMGVMLSITLRCQPQYRVEEHFRFFEDLHQTLEAEREFPLQQFFLLPHSWRFMAQHRRVSEAARSFLAPLYRAYWFVTIDLGLHLILLLLTRLLGSRGLVRFFYRRLVPWTIVRGWKVVDQSQRMLTMEHELFRHVEIEMFVKRSQLANFLGFVRAVLVYCDGACSTITEETWNQVRGLELAESLESLCGTYTHHYPICIRKVLPDATLISPASSEEEPYYAASFINYCRGKEREKFLRFARFLALSTAQLFAARPHWGKVCPLDVELANRLYPKLAEFRQACESFDPDGTFRNEWVGELLFGKIGSVNVSK